MKLFQLLLLAGFLFVAVQPAHAIFVVKPNASQEAATPAAEAKAEKKLTKAERKELRKERKEMRKELRKDLKKAIKNARKNKAADEDLLLIVIITILIPPLGVFLYEGDITSRFWISLLLTLLFYVPGLIYSLIVVLG